MPRRYDRLDITNKLIWNLRDIGHTMGQLYEGKGSQKRILILLSEEGPLTQRALTQRLGIQPGSASEVLRKLEAAGWITRTPSQLDRRTTDLALTETGRPVTQQARAQREARHQEMFAPLSPQEKAQLLALLEKVNDHWDRQYRTSGGRSRRDS